MSYRYKVKIEAHGAKGGDGSSAATGSNNSDGGNGLAVDIEYEVLPATVVGVSNVGPGFSRNIFGNIFWSLKYRRVEGGDFGENTTYSGEKGGKGGDGVIVQLAHGFDVIIAGGGGGGAGDNGHGVGQDNGTFNGGDADVSGTTLGNYYRVNGGNGIGQYTGNGGQGGQAAAGGDGGNDDNGGSYLDGSDGSDYSRGAGGEGGAGASGDGEGKEGSGGGGGGGGYGGGGGGVSGRGTASGGGAGASLVFNNEDNPGVGFKCLDNANIVSGNTNTSVHLKFISYRSSNNGASWVEYWDSNLSTVETTFQNINIPLNNAPIVNAITQSVHWKSTNNRFDFSGNDADSDPFTYFIATTAVGASYGASISDANNSVTVNGSQFIVNSSNNATFTFFYIANDGFSDSAPEQITINKLNADPKFNSISDQNKYILSGQTVSWDLTGDFEDDEEYSFNIGGPYTSSNPSIDIYQSTLLVGTATYSITERKLYFDGSGLEHDNIQSSFNVWVKDDYTSAVSSDTVFVTQYKRLYKHEIIKSFNTTVSNTGFKTPSNVDIATLFQPKSLLNFVTPANTGKFSKSSSTPTPTPVDFSNIFGEYNSDYSGNSIIDTDTGFQIGGTDIREIYAAKKTILDIFDTTPGTKKYRFSLTANTDVLIIVVGGGGAGNHGSKGGHGGHGGKIIVEDITLTPGDYDLSFNVGAGEDEDRYTEVTRRGGDSSITSGLLTRSTAVANHLTAGGYNDNLGGDLNTDAQNGGFQLIYGGNTYDIGGGGGGGKKQKFRGSNAAGKGYFGGQNGYTNTTPSTRAEYGGGGGGGYKNFPSGGEDGGSGGHGLCAILFKQ